MHQHIMLRHSQLLNMHIITLMTFNILIYEVGFVEHIGPALSLQSDNYINTRLQKKWDTLHAIVIGVLNDILVESRNGVCMKFNQIHIIFYDSVILIVEYFSNIHRKTNEN